MNSEVTRVGVLRTGKVLAIMYAFFALIFLPIAVILAIADPVEGMGVVFMIVLYPVAGFIGGVLLAALYNLAARIGGGLQIEIAETYPNNSRTDPYSQQVIVPPGNRIARDEYPPRSYKDNN